MHRGTGCRKTVFFNSLLEAIDPITVRWSIGDMEDTTPGGSPCAIRQRDAEPGREHAISDPLDRLPRTIFLVERSIGVRDNRPGQTTTRQFR